MNKPEGLYIHIPFCDNICSYCDFYKMKAKPAPKARYIAFLLKEMELYKNVLKDVKTVYIGGGTPLSLDVLLLEKLFQGIYQYINSENIEEFTIEANPHDITSNRLELLKKYHINRINIGVQSFNNKKLKILNRNHSKKTIVDAVKLLKSYNFTNYGFDIIFGVGKDAWYKVKNDIKCSIRANVKHLSVYSLIIEDKTILKYYINKGKYQPCSADVEAKIYKKLCNYLKKYNFKHYELSNFAINGYESKHNMIYWNNKHYIGLGAGASGYFQNRRYTNVCNLEAYYQGINNKKLMFSDEVILTKTDKMKEFMILGLRKIEGIDIEEFKKTYKTDLFVLFPFIQELINKQLLILNNNMLFIPEDKLFLSNEVLINFI